MAETQGRDSMATVVHEDGGGGYAGKTQKEINEQDFHGRPSNPRLRSHHSASQQAAKGGVVHRERTNSTSRTANNPDAKLNNPLADYSYDELREMGMAFGKEHDMLGLGGKGDEQSIPEGNAGYDLWAKAAVIAQDPLAFEGMKGLDEDDRQVLRRERTHKWDQPKTLYWLVVLCSVAAAVQGMDETVINGAQLYYPAQFGIVAAESEKNQWLVGLVNSAPYLCCAVVGCWITDPLNQRFGRRGTIFITATISFLCCIWSALTNTWWHLFIARFFLGLGIGPKSATVPVYAAECSPAPIRGALVMQWQFWTAFGIMLGYVADLAFYQVPDKPHITGLSWRLMLGSAGFPALIVMLQVWGCPESPRWLMGKGRYSKAYQAMLRLRGKPLLAARDIFYIHVLLQEEAAVVRGRNRALELFTVPRNRRATLASTIVMFGQQFCGINAIAYYSSTIFLEANFSEQSALLASWGFGMVNFIFALPAFLTIDRFGRRSLLLFTFPFMAAFLLLTGMAFFIPNETARIGVVALGIYLYTAFYSSGEGPVPFTYSAECFPLYIRELGMSWATAVTWLFNFIIAITFPRLLVAFTPQGAFGYYAAWNVVLWILILLFVPETKGLELEALDAIFAVPTEKHAAYQMRQVPWWFKKYIFRSNPPKEQLYHLDSEETRNTYVDKREVQHVEKGEKQV